MGLLLSCKGFCLSWTNLAWQRLEDDVCVVFVVQVPVLSVPCPSPVQEVELQEGRAAVQFHRDDPQRAGEGTGQPEGEAVSGRLPLWRHVLIGLCSQCVSPPLNLYVSYHIFLGCQAHLCIFCTIG